METKVFFKSDELKEKISMNSKNVNTHNQSFNLARAINFMNRIRQNKYKMSQGGNALISGRIFVSHLCNIRNILMCMYSDFAEYKNHDSSVIYNP